MLTSFFKLLRWKPQESFLTPLHLLAFVQSFSRLFLSCLGHLTPCIDAPRPKLLSLGGCVRAVICHLLSLILALTLLYSILNREATAILAFKIWSQRMRLHCSISFTDSILTQNISKGLNIDQESFLAVASTFSAFWIRVLWSVLPALSALAHSLISFKSPQCSYCHATYSCSGNPTDPHTGNRFPTALSMPFAAF